MHWSCVFKPVFSCLGTQKLYKILFLPFWKSELAQKAARSTLDGKIPSANPAGSIQKHPKTGWNTFFEPFSNFFVHFKPFSPISHLKSRKIVWKWTKNSVFYIWSTLQSWLTYKHWSTPWGGTSICLFISSFEPFWTFFNKFWPAFWCA